MGRIHSTITTGTGPADRSRSPTRSRSATPRLSDSVPSRTTACDPWQPGRHPPILVHDAKPEGTTSRFRPPAPTNKRSGEAPRADLGSGRPTGAPKSLKIHQSARPRLKQKQLIELFAPENSSDSMGGSRPDSAWTCGHQSGTRQQAAHQPSRSLLATLNLQDSRRRRHETGHRQDGAATRRLVKKTATGSGQPDAPALQDSPANEAKQRAPGRPSVP